MEKDRTEILEQAVTLLVNAGVENFFIVAEIPKSEQITGENFRTVIGGKKTKIVAMLLEILQQKKDTLGLVLDSFVAVGQLDKIGEKEEVKKMLEQLKEN
ncbi:MAG: hypothetical protein LJE89_00885 [Deltaproteobacteria bacterium]|nr:hypothetical protein [Deltaproteobacteria bacterium]